MIANAALAQEEADKASDVVSEVVVTGSFIRSQTFKPSSPVDIITRKDLETRAPTSVAEFLRDLPYNVNSTVTPASRGPTASTGGGTINLRNLGEGATLVLLNSKRQTKLPREANVTDVNGLVPQIMIRNIEILKDGASSLYGSDAVGGVVNFLTRDDFTGAEVRAQGNFLTYSGKQESRFGALFGGEVAKTHIVAAFEYNNRDEIYPEDQPFTQIRNLSTPWNPGRFVVPRRSATGAITTATTRVQDQGCGVTKQTYFFAAGQPNVTTDSCYYDFWPDSAMVSKEQRYQFYTSAKHEFADWLVFKAEAGYQKAHLYGAQSTSASINVFPAITVPGYNPGVARADADRLAAGLSTAYVARNASGQQLYAVPSAVGSLIPARDAAGNVVLTATPTVASSGIPFNEDTVFEGRILGSQCGLPTANTLDAGVCARTYRQAEDINDAMHLVAGFSGDFGSGWHYETSLTYSKINEENDAQRNNVLVPQLRAALQGFGGPNCNALAPGQLAGTGNCYFFNP
ncbi:MAG: TonB-dependent receptor plug domain-containing protein, partial [Caulobacteraceae bacterium]